MKKTTSPDSGGAEALESYEPDYPYRNLVLYCGELVLGTMFLVFVMALADLAIPVLTPYLFPGWVGHGGGVCYCSGMLVDAYCWWSAIPFMLLPFVPVFRFVHKLAAPSYRRPFPLTGYELMGGVFLGLAIFMKRMYAVMI